MKASVLQRQAVSHLKRTSSNIHGRIVLFGLLVACCYLPIWGRLALKGVLQGHSDLFLQIGFMTLGGQTLWQNREHIQQLTAQKPERIAGYALVGCAIAMIPVSLSSTSIQAFLIMLLLSGLILSTWGVEIFQLYPKAYTMLMICIVYALG